MPDSAPEIMQCMEVWGGNQAVNSSVVMSGIDAWVYSQPFTTGVANPGQTGGDVYFVSSCATGRITRLLIADVSGHGPAVGELAISLRQLMRRYVNYLDPRRFVSEMNRQFTELSKTGLFATAVVTTFFAPTNHITLCNAGHPPPMVYRMGKGWSYLEPGGDTGNSIVDLPLGVEDSSDYRQFGVNLKLGDMVLCYTDGLPEARRANDDEFLGQDGLLEIMNGVALSDPAKIVPSLLLAIAGLHKGNLTGDDVTVLLFRPNGIGKKVTLRNRLLAPLRLGRAIIASFFPGGGPAPWPDHHPANVGGALFDPLSHLWGNKKG